MTAFGGALYAQKVLIVTTEQATIPSQCAATDGQFVLTDLVAAGYPFDVVTYGRYVSMPLEDYDIVVLNGHTSPTSVALVAARCQEAMSAGKKVFINGRDCFYRYSTSGQLLESNFFVASLFPVRNRIARSLSGVPTIPTAIQKDQTISSISYPGMTLATYTFDQEPVMKIDTGGYTVGFLYPQGGVLESSSTATMYWLDYGKVVSFLRYGVPTDIGFANDRVDGQPIASIEVHCHGDYQAIEWLNDLSLNCNMPLANCLVNNTLSSSLKAKWNYTSASNPLMLIGSHSRTHPQDWPSIGVASALDQTIGSVTDLQTSFPHVENYLTFSGYMNPNTEEIDAMYSAGLVFGAQGYGDRSVPLPGGSVLFIQRMPTNNVWFRNLSKSVATPYCLSQTLIGDNALRDMGISHLRDTQQKFQANLKHGMYTYGFIHDTYYSPNALTEVDGQLFSTTIRQGIEYLRDQGVRFIDTKSLILRLRDYMAGSVSVSFVDNSSARVRVRRPGGLINEVKIGRLGDLFATALGAAVVSQHRVGDVLYVTLRPETDSTFLVRWGSPIQWPQGKPANNGEFAAIGNIVTAVFGDWFYIETEERTCGILVHSPDHHFDVGMRVDIAGKAQTNEDDERYVEATSVVRSLPPDDIRELAPLALNCQSLGGGDGNWVQETGSGQRGVSGGVGLNNIGLLVKVCGKVALVDQSTPARWFTITDGFSPVKVLLPAGVPPPSASVVVVTGISSCEKTGNDLAPVIKAKSVTDIPISEQTLYK